MTCRDRSFVPSFQSSNPTQVLPELVPLLAGLLLVVAGCNSTHHVSRTQPNGYARVTEAAAGETARVHFRDGRTMKLENLYVGPDSATGVSPESPDGNRSFPVAAIRSVEFVNRGAGFLQGLGTGFAVPLGAGMVASATEDEEFIPAWFVGAVLGVPGGLVGGIVGAIRGQREIYRFSAPSSEAPPAPATARSRVQNGPSRE